MTTVLCVCICVCACVYISPSLSPIPPSKRTEIFLCVGSIPDTVATSSYGETESYKTEGPLEGLDIQT